MFGHNHDLVFVYTLLLQGMPCIELDSGCDDDSNHYLWVKLKIIRPKWPEKSFSLCICPIWRGLGITLQLTSFALGPLNLEN